MILAYKEIIALGAVRITGIPRLSVICVINKVNNSMVAIMPHDDWLHRTFKLGVPCIVQLTGITQAAKYITKQQGKTTLKVLVQHQHQIFQRLHEVSLHDSIYWPFSHYIISLMCSDHSEKKGKKKRKEKKKARLNVTLRSHMSVCNDECELSCQLPFHSSCWSKT